LWRFSRGWLEGKCKIKQLKGTGKRIRDDKKRKMGGRVVIPKRWTSSSPKEQKQREAEIEVLGRWGGK